MKARVVPRAKPRAKPKCESGEKPRSGRRLGCCPDRGVARASATLSVAASSKLGSTRPFAMTRLFLIKFGLSFAAQRHCSSHRATSPGGLRAPLGGILKAAVSLSPAVLAPPSGIFRSPGDVTRWLKFCLPAALLESLCLKQ